MQRQDNPQMKIRKVLLTEIIRLLDPKLPPLAQDNYQNLTFICGLFLRSFLWIKNTNF